MPEDLKLSQIGSSQLPPPFRGLHSPGVRKHCQIIFACYFQKSIEPKACAFYNRAKTTNIKTQSINLMYAKFVIKHGTPPHSPPLHPPHSHPSKDTQAFKHVRVHIHTHRESYLRQAVYPLFIASATRT